MPTDGATAKFLYTILKQLDLKSIDWNNVAGQLDITNGHAARMRFSRFKQQMEGIPSAPRKPRPTVPRQKKPKTQKPPKPEQQSRDDLQFPIKPDPESALEPMNGVELGIKAEAFVKDEPRDGDEESVLSPEANVNAGSMGLMSLEQQSFQDNFLEPYDDANSLPPSPLIKPEPIVKMEPFWEG